MDKPPFQPKPTPFRSMREVFKEAVEEMALPPPSTKLPDWPLFNKVTGGLRPKEYSILCGSTGAGKTTFLANISAQLVKQNVRHFVMSVETGHVDFMKRVLSTLNGKDLNTGDVIPADEIARATTQVMPYLEANCMDLALYDNRVPLEQLLYDLEYMHKHRGAQVAMIDNLNFFLEITRAQDQIIEMDRVTHELIMFCKRTPMHIFMVMHPKKTDKDGDDRVESVFDIKGSSTSVQEAQNVFLFNKPKTKDVSSGDRHYMDREVSIRKMRRRGHYVPATLIYKSHGTRYTEVGYK